MQVCLTPDLCPVVDAFEQRYESDGGTALTANHARQIGKPCLVVALEIGIEPAAFRDWLATHPIAVLNVAGPRESKRPGVYAATVRCLDGLLQELLRS